MSSYRLFVVAIDFGTTYSGYGFSEVHRKDKIYTYNWQLGKDVAAKTPTSILFSPRGTFDSFGYEAEEKYAALSIQNENKEWYFFKRFKLTLYKNTNLNEKTTIRDFTGKTLPALKVFSAGIKFLKDHLFTHFQERIGILRDTDIQWVLTVPAIWDEAAKKFMRKAAEENSKSSAGIAGDQLILALEPESAALYCQSGKSHTDLDPMVPGSTFLLLDCGGGTVDITIHKVKSNKSMMEVHRASGGTWGGIKVDDAFQEYLLVVFGFEAITSLSKNDVLQIEKKFESLKKEVCVDKLYYSSLPFNLRRSAPPDSLIAGKLKLPFHVIKGFFDKPINSICEHIKKLLSSSRVQNVDTIVLVGGFSESKILQREIECQFPSMSVLTPKESSTAVVKGAVLFGLCPEKIASRLSPYTYGVDMVEPFDIEKHPLEKMIIHHGKEYCDDVFSVHVKRNQEVRTGTTISDKDYYPLSKSQTTMPFRVATSTSRYPKFVTDSNCKIIGRFVVKFPKVEYQTRRKSVNVKMIFSGTELRVEARDSISNDLYETSFEFE